MLLRLRPNPANQQHLCLTKCIKDHLIGFVFASPMNIDLLCNMFNLFARIKFSWGVIRTLVWSCSVVANGESELFSLALVFAFVDQCTEALGSCDLMAYLVPYLNREYRQRFIERRFTTSVVHKKPFNYLLSLGGDFETPCWSPVASL
jgi:hypothetical protein